MAEASLSIKTSCRVDDSFVSSGKSNINFMAIELNKRYRLSKQFCFQIKGMSLSFHAIGQSMFSFFCTFFLNI